jgi:hypothetical protein
VSWSWILLLVSRVREADTQQVGVPRTRTDNENHSGVAVKLLTLQGAAGNKAVGQLIGRGGGAVTVQRRIEAYQRSDFSKTRVIDASEALRYLTDTTGSDLTGGQLRWLAEVTQRLRPRTLEQGIGELANDGRVVAEFEDGTRNSAAVALLSALEKLGGPVVEQVTGAVEAESGVEDVASSSGAKTPVTIPSLTPKERREQKGGATKPPQQPPPQRSRKQKKYVSLDLADDTADFSRLPANGVIKPSRVKFSQDTAGSWYSQKFKMGPRDIQTVEAHAEAMKESGDGSRTPAIEIVLFKKRIMTLNNRRLKAHQLAGIDIPYIKSNKYRSDAAIEGHPNVDAAAPRNNLTLR